MNLLLCETVVEHFLRNYSHLPAQLVKTVGIIKKNIPEQLLMAHGWRLCDNFGVTEAV